MGAIVIDGINLWEYETSSLRQALSVIFQDYGRYQLPARENIALGDIAYAHRQRASEAGILVLDEPTSALDANAEYDVFSRFRDLTENCLAILISHWFSTVRMADRTYVLSAGAITESGSHDELMRRGGTYAAMFGMQAWHYQ